MGIFLFADAAHAIRRIAENTPLANEGKTDIIKAYYGLLLPDIDGGTQIMTAEHISSRKNPLLQQVKKLLSSKKEREKAGLFVADGTKLLEEAVKYYSGLHTVILSDGVEAEVPEGVRLVRVPEDVMVSISPMETPQGALFLCRLPEKEIFIPKHGMLLLDGIQDPGNIGTILRTADALQVPVALLEGCADPYSHKVVRSSMGAVFRTPVIQTTWAEAKAACRNAGIPVGVTALSDRAKDLRKTDLARMAVVIGSEGRGVRKEILDEADAELIIPMNPKCESLNAAIAASIVMWEMTQS
jgi:TrmH family RNA methyltransferase